MKTNDTHKLINNKDGNTGDRSQSFVSYTPNSYDVINQVGDVVGTFTQLRNMSFPKAQVMHWVGMGRSFTYLKDVRAFVKTL